MRICGNLRKGAHTVMPHPINEFATGGEWGGGVSSRRPLPESVSQDVDCALQIVGQVLCVCVCVCVCLCVCVRYIYIYIICIYIT